MKRNIAINIHTRTPPDGPRNVIRVAICDSVEKKYNEILACGCRITSEKQENGDVHMAIQDPAIGNFVFAKVKAGNSVDAGLVEMLHLFDKEEFAKWKEIFPTQSK